MSASLRRLLSDMAALLMGIPADVYHVRIAQSSGTIGAHVRHALDHVAALVSAAPAATLSYDHRSRGTAVETDPDVAVRELMALDAALERWPSRSLDEPVRVASVVSANGEVVVGWSTLGRELAFVVSHTIHHQAIIAVLLERHGLALPHERFGYAPSTPQAA
jgi:uncharacterized damage-inducible protein DinB